MFIKDLENIIHRRFANKKDLENYLTTYFCTTVKINDFEGELDFVEDNHLLINNKRYSELFRIHVIDDNDYSITADGTSVYITVNGKQYKLTPAS